MREYSKADLKQEQEANYFAMCLLMPQSLFLAEWKKLKDAGINEDEQVTQLAKIFDVPLFTVPIRMQQVLNLDFINSV